MIKTLLFLAVLLSSVYSQVIFDGAGINIGAGQLNGNLNAITGYYLSPHIDFKQSLVKSFTVRLLGVYGRDIDQLFGSSSLRKYFPYIAGGGVQVFETVPLTASLYLDYGAGVLMLSDHTYDDLTGTSYGATVSAAVYTVIGGSGGSKWLLGIGGQYGQTFSTTNPGFLMYYAGIRYRAGG